MSGDDIHCEICQRRFVDTNALWQHRKFRHKAKPLDNPHPARDDDDISYGDIPIEAQRKQRAGEPLEDWEKPYAY